MGSRLMLHEELCKILGSRNVYFNTPESVKMNYPAIRYSLSDLDNRSAGNEVYIQNPSYSVILIDPDPDSPIAKKLSVLSGCRLSRSPYPANGLYHFPFTLKTSKGNVSEIFDEYYNRGCADTEKKYENVAEQIESAYNTGYEEGYEYGNIINPNWTNFSYFCIGRPDLGSRLKYSDTANAKTMAQMFFGYDTSVVPNADYIVPSLDTRNCTNFNAMFNWGAGIAEIGLMDISKATTASSVQGMFNACSGLKKITFAKECIKLSISFNSSAKLDDTSIQSIIDGLADLTGQTTQTLDFHSDIVTKLTDEQWMQIYNKNWTAI